jgi:hypothetical protein
VISRFVWPIALVWSLSVVGGFFWLVNRSFKAGESGTTPVVWPTHDAPLRLSPSSKTLVMFVHPKCPCSVASLTELENTLATQRERPSVSIVFYEPAKSDSSWRNTAIMRQAAKIPGAELVWDLEGRIADFFGAKTSGHVVLYDSSGKLKFSGGVTVMRGHVGPCQGQRNLVAAQEGQAAASLSSEVYGCAIHNLTPAPDATLKEGEP